MQRLVPIKDTVVSRLCESFIGDRRINACVMRASPIGFAGIGNLCCTPFRKAELYKVIEPRSRSLPLFPDIHSETAAQLFIPALHCIAHTCYSEIAKPSSDEYSHIVHHLTDVSALTAGSQFFELLLCFPEGLCMGSNEYSMTCSRTSSMVDSSRQIGIC